MAEMTLPTVIESNGGFGGMNPGGLGAGFIGGLILGSLWNNGGFGFGGNNAAAATMAASNGVTEAVQQGTISNLQSAAALTNTINQGTIANMQGNAQLSDKLCGSTNHISSVIDSTGDQLAAAINQATLQAIQTAQGTNDRLCAINNNITNQGYENRLQAQALAAQLQQQHAQLSAQISDENCKDRELMREIQAQAVRDQLTQAQAQNAALTAQINLTNQLTAQTSYLIDQLKTTTA